MGKVLCSPSNGPFGGIGPALSPRVYLNVARRLAATTALSTTNPEGCCAETTKPPSSKPTSGSSKKR